MRKIDISSIQIQIYLLNFLQVLLELEKNPSKLFIEFMLNIIKETIKNDQVTDQVKKLIVVMSGNDEKAVELMNHLNLSHRATFRNNYLKPEISAGLIEMTIPNKPNSRF